MLPVRAIAGSLRSFWTRGRGVERAGYVVGALLFLSGIAHLAILVLGGDSWGGPVSLRKAATFGLSFGVTLITIVWVASFLRLGARARAALLRAFSGGGVGGTALGSRQGVGGGAPPF